MENTCECKNQQDVEKKQKEPVHVVLQVDFHCDGCIARIVRSARCLEGVETVRADPVSNKLTLIGFMDPVKTAEKLQNKTNKKVELLSPKPKKETKVNNDTKPDVKTTMVTLVKELLSPKPKKETKVNNDTKPDVKTTMVTLVKKLLSPKPKKETKVNNDTKPDVKTTMIAVTTVNLKLDCACHGCIKRIHKTIFKTKGVHQVKIDREKAVVSVTGTMEVTTVTENLKRNLKKTIQVVPEKEDKKKENAEEGISKPGSPALPCYGFNYGLGHYAFMLWFQLWAWVLRFHGRPNHKSF